MGIYPYFIIKNELLRQRNVSTSAAAKRTQVLVSLCNKLVFINLSALQIAAAQALSFSNKTVIYRASNNTTAEIEMPFSHTYAGEAFTVRRYNAALEFALPFCQ